MNRLVLATNYAALLSFLLVSASSSFAFAPIKHRWKSSSIAFYIRNLDEPNWRAGFIEASKRWEDTPVDFKIKTINAHSQYACRSNGRNEAWWARNNCGDAWGSRTLAVTSRYFRGRDEMKEADIMYNSNRSWDIYDGNRNAITDFVRVTVHELGHALGADHSDVRDSIMYPSISSRFLPTIDDLYGLSSGAGYGWESHNNLKIKASGDGYVQVRPKVFGTVGMSKDFSESFTDFSRFDCDGNCSHWLQAGLRLTLVAVATNGGSFVGWEGESPCESEIRCSLTPLQASASVKAVFSKAAQQPPLADADGDSDLNSVPQAPELVHVNHDLMNDEVRIEWSAVAGATMYKVLRGDAEAIDFPLIRKTGKTAIVDRGLAGGVAYHYRVKACNDYGCGKLSNRGMGYM